MKVSPVHDPLPRVSIVVVNYDGLRHLPPFFESVAQLTYPAELVEIIVVDNGSTDGSRAWLQKHVPTARVLANDRNEGFAAAVQQGAGAATGQYLALLNNDMQLDPGWIEAMLAPMDPPAGVSCVASTILDWEGVRVDFVDAAINFHGFGQQLGYELPIDRVDPVDGARLPFACGGAMMVDRARFEQVGGFDPAFFAYFEDVDFGWRLRLAGDDIVLAADAVVRHRHHGTSAGMPPYQRLLLLERNALRMLYKNLGDDALGRVMSGALMLLSARAVLDAGLGEGDLAPGSEPLPDQVSVPVTAIARLAAVSEVLGDLDGLASLRRRVQALRRRPDGELFELFRRPFEPLGSDDPSYVERFGAVRRGFGLDQLFDRPGATRVAVLAYDRIGPRMAGPSVRCWELAKALSRHAHVTVLSEHPVERTADGVHVARFRNEEELLDAVATADVVLVHGYAVQRYPRLAHTKALLVVDLYDPWVFELLEMQMGELDAGGDHLLARDVDIQRELLDVGDFFVCASERQRDYWMGMLTARGRLDRATYRADPTLRSLIDVVPYGCPSEPPTHRTQRLKGVHPAISADDVVVLWTGGAWQWFDPELVLRGFVLAHEQDPRLRLYVMGGRPSGEAHLPVMDAARRFHEAAKATGLVDRAIVFGDWVDYDDRVEYLLEADMAVLATKDVAETRLAFRSRVLDHLWTGLPTITTPGDVLAEELETSGAGIVVPVGDEQALATSILSLAMDEERRSGMSARARELSSRYGWSSSVRALLPLLERPWRWREIQAVRPRPTHLALDAQVLLALGGGGVGGRRGHGAMVERLKSTRLYPFMRRVRRSSIGLRLWGAVPGE